ncbi:MAG: hypothetical protein ACOZAO_02335 [Patescibacteria group bacterium]
MEEVISLFILIGGYIVGLGAVTVIDTHGFLGRNSPYWTRATITAHKVTKPLIWLGTILALIGATLFYNLTGITHVAYIHWGIFALLILNGCFLSFWISPKLLKQERDGRAEELLPTSMQISITLSFIISFFGWWGTLFLFLNHLVSISSL